MKNQAEVAWRIWASLSHRAMVVERSNPLESERKLVKPADFKGFENTTQHPNFKSRGKFSHVNYVHPQIHVHHVQSLETLPQDYSNAVRGVLHFILLQHLSIEIFANGQKHET